MQIEAIGNITNCKCARCGESFPVFTFSADTDMATIGYVSLTNVNSKDIAVVEAGPNESPSSIASRMGSDYRASAMSFEVQAASAGVSFQEFCESYRPPSVTYSCIYCSGPAGAVGEEAVAAFRAHNKIAVYP